MNDARTYGCADEPGIQELFGRLDFVIFVAFVVVPCRAGIRRGILAGR